MGIRVFPDVDTCWHYDDKVAQKYLFEALKMPLVPSYVFYSKGDAVKWANQVSYPKVFKLRGGDADLGLQERKRRSQSLPIHVRTVSVGRQAQNRAEKSHPTKNQRLRWSQVPLWDRNVLQSFLRCDAASGNWQPIITRRVMRAPNASESRKESVASSHTSPFYKIFGLDNRLLKSP